MINSFISEVKQRGLARNNRYEVLIPLPFTSNEGIRLTRLFCDAVNLPGLNVATAPSRIYGEVREMPYEFIYEPVQLSFYVDAGMEVKMAFERWMASIINPATRTINYYKDYTRDVQISAVTVDGNQPYAVTLFECYPKSISAIQMDAAGKDVMKLSVTLQYKYWNSAGDAQTSTYRQTYGEPVTNRQDPPQVFTGEGYEIASDDLYVEQNGPILLNDQDL